MSNRSAGSSYSAKTWPVVAPEAPIKNKKEINPSVGVGQLRKLAIGLLGHLYGSKSGRVSAKRPKYRSHGRAEEPKKVRRRLECGQTRTRKFSTKRTDRAAPLGRNRLARPPTWIQKWAGGRAG